MAGLGNSQLDAHINGAVGLTQIPGAVPAHAQSAGDIQAAATHDISGGFGSPMTDPKIGAGIGGGQGATRLNHVTSTCRIGITQKEAIGGNTSSGLDEQFTVATLAHRKRVTNVDTGTRVDHQAVGTQHGHRPITTDGIGERVQIGTIHAEGGPGGHSDERIRNAAGSGIITQLHRANRPGHSGERYRNVPGKGNGIVPGKRDGAARGTVEIGRNAAGEHQTAARRTKGGGLFRIHRSTPDRGAAALVVNGAALRNNRHIDGLAAINAQGRAGSQIVGHRSGPRIRLAKVFVPNVAAGDLEVRNIGDDLRPQIYLGADRS